MHYYVVLNDHFKSCVSEICFNSSKFKYWKIFVLFLGCSTSRGTHPNCGRTTAFCRKLNSLHEHVGVSLGQIFLTVAPCQGSKKWCILSRSGTVQNVTVQVHA